MLINIDEISNIYLYISHVDFRKGMYSLCGFVGYEFNDEAGKNIFIFTNRSRDKARVLYWDDTGYALWHKALEKDKFRWPTRGEHTVALTPDQLKRLLQGLSIEAHIKGPPKSFY